MLQYPIQLPPLDLRPQKKSGKHAAAPPKPAPPPPPPPSAPPQDDVPEDPLLPGDVVGEGCHLLGEPISRVPVGQYLQGPLSPSTPSLSHSASTSSSSSDGSDSAGSAYEDAPPAKSFQVIRKLGTGSYAVVYLVAEVLDDDERADSSDEEFDGMLGSFDETQAKHVARAPRLGRHYAIKCLSKANLDEEQLQAQAIEVIIHQSLAPHANIVTLFRTLESASYLLLLLEYVEGEDLFYFLEGGRDSCDDSHTPDPMQSPSRTPTTPSLLAASSPSLLLSRSRLRLVASMFRQMCDAVEACHAQSVFHRDIKPENFIVTESTSTPCSTTDPNPTTPIRPSASRRASAMSIAAASSHAMSRPSSSTPTRRVVVKLTDFGLSTRDHESADMDCGSAPYMSYECRNNVAPTYRPKHADVWSLGIVLINMLYHHNPWTDTLLPAKSDPYKGGACSSFLQYLQNPVQFFLTRFTGMTLPAARFLAERVFCVPDDDRCSANEFAEWVSGTGAYAVNIPSTSYRPSSSSSMSASEDRYGRGGLGVVFGVETRPRTTSIVLAHRISAASIPPSRRPSSRASFAPSLNVGHIAAEPEFDQTQDFSADVCVSQAPLHRRASSDAGDSVASGMFVTSRSTSTKRRKRGTRRGKGNNGSQTPTSVAGGHEPGAMVDVLAEASQQLAREISRVSAPKAESLNIEEVPRERVPSAGLPSTSSLRSGNSRQSVASAHSGSSGTMSTSRRSRRTPFEPPSMYGIPEPLCTNNAAPATRPPSGKVATTRKITQNVSTSTSSLQGKKQSKWKLSFGKSQLPPVADDGASTMSMDFANTDNMSIASFGMGSGPMGQFSSPPRELSPPRAHGPRPPREASPSPSIRVEPRPHMSVAAANVTDLIMGLNAPPATPSTPSTGQSASFSLDATSVRGRRTLDGGSPHSRPRNFGSPSPSRGRASAASSIYSDYVPPVPPLPHSKGAAPPIFAKTPSPHRGGGVDANWASLSGASLEVPVGSNQASLPAKPVKISSGRGGSGNWRNSMSSTATGTTSATTSTTQFTRYSNGSRGSVSTTATSVSAGSWRAGGGGSISSGHSGKTSPTSIASNVNGKGGYQTLPRNIKVMNGVPGILHELPRGQNPSFDGYAQQQRKQRTRKQPKDLTLDTINERPTASTSAQKSPIAEGPAGRLADAATSTTDLDGVEYDGQKKVQRGQINALAKMLSALRR